MYPMLPVLHMCLCSPLIRCNGKVSDFRIDAFAARKAYLDYFVGHFSRQNLLMLDSHMEGRIGTHQTMIQSMALWW